MNQNNAYLVNSFATAGKTLVLGIGQKRPVFANCNFSDFFLCK